MTSKNLLFKLQKEDLKRRLWTIALSILAFFLFLTVVLAIHIGNNNLNQEQMARNITSIIGYRYIIVSFITIAGAVICGLSGFFYLHSRKKVDLYHSIPVRREVLFTVSYINGLLIYFVPYILNVILCFIILQINGHMNAEYFITAMSAVGINFLFYCLIYTLAIIAVMLTGNIIISCLGTGVFLLYGTLIMGIKEMYCLDFFNTYSGFNEGNPYSFLSPIVIYFEMIDLRGLRELQVSSVSILKIVLVTVLLLLFSLFLYKKRPSEAAGKAMSFSVSKPVIKFLLVIPAALGGGIVFRQIASNGSTGWFIFGLVFAFIISYGIIEIIYNFDIRSAFNHKKHMLVSGVVVAVIVCIFQFDMLKYDLYIPDKNKIESMSVYISGLDSRQNYMYQDLQENGYRYMGADTYHLKYMELSDLESAYALAGLGIEEIKEIENMEEKGEIQAEKYYTYKVKYTFKNGRTAYRSYNLTLEKSYDRFRDIFASEEFKKGHYPIYKWDAGNITSVSCNNMLEYKEFGLDAEEKQELLDIYREELLKLTLDEVIAGRPSATITFLLKEKNTASYYVYPQFNNTVTFLKEHGFDPSVQAGIQDIKSISINNYQADRNGQYKEYPYGYTVEDTEVNTAVTYVDKEKIEAILPHLIESQYYWNYYSVLKGEEDLEVKLVLSKDEYGNDAEYIFYFRDGSMPDFVKEDVGYKEE